LVDDLLRSVIIEVSEVFLKITRPDDVNLKNIEFC